jgi:acetyl-CoA carboxylase biotin carboxyl carrier protein
MRPPAPKKASKSEATPERRGWSHEIADLAESLARVLREHDLTEIEVEEQGESGAGRVVRVRRGAAPAVHSGSSAPTLPPPPASLIPPPPLSPVAQVAQAAASPAPAGHPAVYITSPFVGTFYRSPSPEAPAFVEVGAQVRKGQVLCIIEAMKLMNEIEAEVDGTIVACLAENGQPVEYGEPLFQVRP